MSFVNNALFVVCIVALTVGAVVGTFTDVRLTDVEHIIYTRNSGELTNNVLVGQTFSVREENLSAIGVMLATYSGRNNTGEVTLHVKNSISDTTDLRASTVAVGSLGDNQFHRFDFEPIKIDKTSDFFFYITSASSSPGNAITVDINTQDPYHLGTAYIVRGQGPNITNPQILEKSGKQTIDVAFKTYHTVSARVAIMRGTVSWVQTFIATWDEKLPVYIQWSRSWISAILFLAVLWILTRRSYNKIVMYVGKKRFTIILLSILLAIGILLRLLYAIELPITNDEGNYMYDAQTLLRGSLAGGDGYVKAPLVVVWIALWQLLLGNTIIAARASSVFIGSLLMIPLYFLAKNLWSSQYVTRAWLPEVVSAGWGRRVGLVCAAIWAFFGASIVFNIYAHTQPLALFFGVSGLSILLVALRGPYRRGNVVGSKAPRAHKTIWFIGAGLLLGLAVVSRKSMLALGLIPILLIMTEGRTMRERFSHFLSVGIGFLIVIILFLGIATSVYGTEGFWEAIGVNSAEDGLSSVEPEQIEQVRAYSLRGMTPFFRESLPLIFLALIGLGSAVEQFIRSFFRHIKGRPSASVIFFVDHIMPKLGWIVVWGVFGWAWSFFFEYEGDAFMKYGIPILWYAFGFLLFVYTVFPRHASEKIVWRGREEKTIPVSTQPRTSASQIHKIIESVHNPKDISRHASAALLVPLWILGLVFFYMNWIKFHATYISEFIPPLVLLSSFGAITLFYTMRRNDADRPLLQALRRVITTLVVVVLFWSIGVSNHITYVYEHTGTFHQASSKQVAAWANKNIPKDASIFTGAALIPYLSGHHTALDIAHPRWYAYEFTRKDTERINTFLPSAEEMLQAYRETEWFLLDKQTGFSFLMEYSEIEAGLETDFEKVQAFENGSNTLTFYRRVR